MKDRLKQLLEQKCEKILKKFDSLTESEQETILLNEFRLLVPKDNLPGVKTDTLFMDRTWFDQRQKYRVKAGKPNGKNIATILFQTGYQGGGKFHYGGKNYEIVKRNNNEYVLQIGGFKYDDVATIDSHTFALVRSRSKMYYKGEEFTVQRNAFNLGSIVSIYDSSKKLVGQLGWGNIVTLHWKSTITNKIEIPVQIFMLSMYLGLDTRHEEEQELRDN